MRALLVSISLLSALSVTASPFWRTHLKGFAGRKADTFFAERIFGEEAKGRIYEETVQAFRTHYDDTRSPEEDSAGKWISGKGLWQGEYWGKTMLSAAAVCEYSGDAELKKWLRDRARQFVKEFQQPDGYLCTYKDRYFIGGPRPDAKKKLGWESEVFCWNIWGRKYTMWALIEIARVTNSPDLLVAASRIMDQLISQLDEKGIDIADTGFFVGLPSMSVLKPLLLLYRATGNEKYRTFARHIAKAMDRDGDPAPNLVRNAYSPKPVHEWYPNPAWWAKAYESMSCMEGLIAYADMEKDSRVAKAMRLLAGKIEAFELNAIGSVGFFDHFTHSAACVNVTSEPCDITHWIRVNRDLFIADDDPSRLERIEFAWFNAFLGGVYRDGKWGAHSVRSHGSRHRSAPHQVGMRFHQCCIDNMPRTFCDIADTAVTFAPDGAISVNFYSDVESTCGDVNLVVSGGYPFADNVKVRLQTPVSRKLRLRVPKSFDSMSVNGVRAEGDWFNAEVPAGGGEYAISFVRSPKIIPFAGEALPDPRADRFEEARENPEMKGLSRTSPGIRIVYGPILLAKGLYAGTPREDVMKDMIGANSTLKIMPSKPLKTDGAWHLTFVSEGKTRELAVGDFASIADADDPHNLFSIWF